MRIRGRPRFTIFDTEDQYLLVNYGILQGHCPACLRPYLPYRCSVSRSRSIDHWIAQELGGKDWPWNLHSLCIGCNVLKGIKPIEWLFDYKGNSHILPILVKMQEHKRFMFFRYNWFSKVYMNMVKGR